MKSLLLLDVVDASDALMEAHLDITGAEIVQVQQGGTHNNVLWVNINGICVLRVCRAKHLVFENIAPPTSGYMELRKIIDGANHETMHHEDAVLEAKALRAISDEYDKEMEVAREEAAFGIWCYLNSGQDPK